MTSFFAFLEKRAQRVDSLLCMGLDPHPQDLIEATPEGARVFCLKLIEETAAWAAAFKPNVAFFEAFGPGGVQALKDVIAAVPEDIPVILDAKRGDIASTAEAYARAAFQVLGAGALTVNPYLGYDAIAPFLADPARGVFLLCKTSNPGSRDLQDLRVFGESQSESDLRGGTLYERVARLAQGWNTKDNLGLVVGATDPEALLRVRALVPDFWILAPGVGAQGGDLGAALRAGLRQDGLGLLVPLSRGVSRADHPGEVARNLCEQINRERRRLATIRPEDTEPVPFLTPELSQLADTLLEVGCIQFGDFKLKSGLRSPIYIDLRRLVTYPQLLSRVATAYLPLLRKLTFDHLAALPYAALPIATAISLQSGWSLIYPRKEVKAYGTRAAIEGSYAVGEQVVVIDDLTTTGESKFEAIRKLTSAGLVVKDVVVLVDRQSGAAETLAAEGFNLQAVFILTQLIDHWQKTGRITDEKAEATREFIRDSHGT